MESKESRKRYIQKIIRFTPNEYEHVKLVMESMGIEKFQYYAINQLQYGQLMTIDFSELKHLRVAINRIGVNINQIAKHVNEDQLTTIQELEQVQKELAHLKELLYNFLAEQAEDSLKKRKQSVRTDITEW